MEYSQTSLDNFFYKKIDKEIDKEMDREMKKYITYQYYIEPGTSWSDITD
jgi:hypothetical protein